MFTPTKKILEKARRGNYAVAHFNINNMEIAQAVVKAAEKQKAPIILSTSEGAIKYAGMEMLYNIAKTLAKNSNVPIAFHLDHGRDLNIIKKAINMGYSSVMFDGSHLDFKENVTVTKRLVKLAHKKNVSVEAELGTIGGAEDTIKAKKIIYTNPKLAQEFVQKTNCDFLAIAIGTSHGAYKFKGKSALRLDILKEIKQRINVPLVLHGASAVPKNLVAQAQKYGANLTGVHGVSSAQVKQAIKYGINKINTDTDLRLAFDAAVRKVIKTKPKDFDPRHILDPARDLIEKVAVQRIKLFGSSRKR
jgi:fructose-bisphosphate aldolase, class II